MLSALKEEAGVEVDMGHLDFDLATMLTFAKYHIRKIPNNRNLDLVALPGAFFGQAVNEFQNVSGLPRSHLQ